MRKLALAVGVGLLGFGSLMILGAYFIFNKSYIIGSRKLRWIGDAISFPDDPILLSEGDTITLQISMNKSIKTQVYIAANNGDVLLAKQIKGNSTLYYVVLANDYYTFSARYEGGAGQAKINYNIEVMKTGPNQVSLVFGILLFVIGISIWFMDILRLR